MSDNIYKRVARIEAVANAQKAQEMDVLEEGYKKACEAKNEEDAAMHIREIRNKLLADADSHMAIDRFGITTPSGSTFVAWLSFLKALGEIISGNWAKYRQELRDIPEQAGFPFDVTFPEKPETNE